MLAMWDSFIGWLEPISISFSSTSNRNLLVVQRKRSQIQAATKCCRHLSVPRTQSADGAVVKLSMTFAFPKLKIGGCPTRSLLVIHDLSFPSGVCRCSELDFLLCIVLIHSTLWFEIKCRFLIVIISISNNC